jgi:periplasmic protein TonB
MKPILTAGILALGIHGLLFSLDFNWLGRSSLKHPVPLVLNMTLTSVSTTPTPNPTPQKKPVLKQKTMGQNRKKPVPKKKTVASKNKKPVLKKKNVVKTRKTPPVQDNPKPLKKASSPKPVQAPLQPKTNSISKAIAEPTNETASSDSIPDKNGIKVVSKFVEHDGASLSPLETIHEAKPAYRSNPSPKYPRIARIRGFQGNVLLDVLVNADGRVDDIKIFKSSGYPVLDRSAESTVKQWLFEPGRIGKRKVDMWVRVPIRFELTD